MIQAVAGALACLLLVVGTGCGGCGGDDDGGGGTADGGAGEDAATAQLTVHVTGAGAGTVTSDRGDLACTTADGTCTVEVAEGDVELTAAPSDGYVFLSWLGGGCRLGATCSVTVDGDAEVSAAFVPLAFSGFVALDGDNAPLPGGGSNVWTVLTDGADAAPITELTAEGAAASQPRWSPDGSRLLFQSNRAIAGGDALQEGNVWNVFTIDADGTHLTAITELTAANAFSGEAAWSPDGSRIAYRSNRLLDGGDAIIDSFNMWVVDADGTDAAPLTDVTSAAIGTSGPRWSPDGELVAYQSNRALTGVDAVNPGGAFNLWVVGADGADDHALTELSDIEASSGQLDWSPDGARLVYVSERSLDGEDAAGTAANVWLIDVDDGDTAPITTVESGGISPQTPIWSPDGARIYYQAHRALDGSDDMIDARNLWVMDADGGNPEPLTTYENGVYLVTEPRPTPDGSAVFFLTNGAPDGDDEATVNDTTNVWGIGADGDGLHAVTEYDAADADCYDPGGF